MRGPRFQLKHQNFYNVMMQSLLKLRDILFIRGIKVVPQVGLEPTCREATDFESN